MVFRNLTLKTDYSQSGYPHKSQDIENINKIFEPYGLKVNDVKEGSQVVRYVINLPLDVKLQGKIRRATKDIEYTLTTALKSSDISYSHVEDTLIIERKGKFNIVPFGGLYTVAFHNNSNPLSVILGQDLNGNPVFTDIAKAPHILIAGSTGSGKSEAIHSIIASLIMHNTYTTPSNYRDGKRTDAMTKIDVIDMKGTEYTKYKNTYVNIIDDETVAFNHLNHLCDLMDSRYRTFAECKCDDIDEYISKGNKLSRIVCIIDEFADLILRYPKVETAVVRIAQKARACGIHLIIGTQSPRADVVTGLIKANIPFRIALNTTNSMESRIILDETGAEKLFGKGDMLIKKGGNSPVRVQGCYVADEDKINLAKVIEKLYPTLESSVLQKKSTVVNHPKKTRKNIFWSVVADIWDKRTHMTNADHIIIATRK